MKKIIFIFLFCLFARNAWATTKVTIQDSPSQIYPNQEFNVVFNIINDFISSDSYYVKGRIGSASASLNKGETYNSTTNSWLSDTSSWSSFPIINFNNDTIATATVKLRANQTVFIENNLLVIRVNKNGNYDSSSAALLVFESIPTLTTTPIPTATSTFTPTPTPTPQSYDNIYISEAFVNPPTGGKEWVEIYNNNDFTVSLNNWYLDDIENAGSTPRLISLEIEKKSYAVFNLTSSMFNNDGDSVRLLDFNKNLKDDFEYVKTEQGKSLGRTSLESDDFCFQEPSKNSVNNYCINPTPTSILTQSPTKTIILNTKSPTTKPNNFDVSIHRNVNFPTAFIVKNYDNGDVLGISSNIPNNNLLLIRCFTFISFSYSLLTIISILFKMKLSYGKNKNFYSPSLHSS